MITFLCGKCGKRLQVADEVAGKKCRCPSCTTINNVPSNAAGPSPSQQQPSLGDLFPSSTSGYSSTSTSGSSSSAGGLWSGLDSQPSSSPGQAANPYAVNPNPPPPPRPSYGPPSYGQPNYLPQYGAGYVPESNPVGMIFGVLSVCMPLFICFYGLSIPLGLIFGIAAWILSSTERKKAAQGIVRAGLADVGYILGIIGTVINGILLLMIGGFVIFVIVSASKANQF